MKLSVIIPALDEARTLPALLRDLLAQQGVLLQIIVADGGSQDRTVAEAELLGAQVVHAPRGRGAQMNAGARLAQGECLLFLHADSRLPDVHLLAQALEALRRETHARGAVAGHFPLRFERHERGHEDFFRYLEGKTRLNRPWTIHGDQGLLIRVADFAKLGGYDERLPYFEDVRLAETLFVQGRWLLLPGVLVTSARRFETEGHRARYTLMALMMALHAAGVDEFFTQAPALYRAQAGAAALNLRPFLNLVYRLLAARGRWKSLRAAGPFLRQNAWQLAYALDLWRERPDLPSLKMFERRWERRLDHPFFDGLAALLGGVWLYVGLPISLRAYARVP